jgi:aldehyde dehydrogenase (NAD+)
VWTENINLALDVAPKIKAGVVWVNCTNLFDAASGFGGYRESGFGREGGKEGMWEYVKPVWGRGKGKGNGAALKKAITKRAKGPLPPIDRTYKLFIGGAQVRPDQGYSRKVLSPSGTLLAEVAEGNRKDIRNAVEAAHAAESWAKTSGHNRGQVLYYLAENLAQRADEFAERISGTTGRDPGDGRREVDASIARLFSYAAWADKYDGAVHQTPIRGVTLAMNEPIGVIGIACPEEAPLLGFVSLVGPAVAVGNTVIAIPSEAHPLAATELYTVLDASDVPAGVINIVTGAKDALAKVLAEHDDVDAMWYFGSQAAGAEVERASAGNMKRTWVEWRPRDWQDSRHGEGREFLREATQVKNIWIPYGE